MLCFSTSAADWQAFPGTRTYERVFLATFLNKEN